MSPELHRLEGELTLQAEPGAHERAEQCFRAAIADARRRQERSLELRAATSLYRLRRAGSDDAEARRALTALYASFTEGLSTADLLAAKSLLE